MELSNEKMEELVELREILEKGRNDSLEDYEFTENPLQSRYELGRANAFSEAIKQIDKLLAKRLKN